MLYKCLVGYLYLPSKLKHEDLEDHNMRLKDRYKEKLWAIHEEKEEAYKI